MTSQILVGDAFETLRTLESDSVQCCMTSPPYWGLRDYGEPGQLGLESTPEEHVAAMVAVFEEVRRVLRPDGVLWLNYGDCYGGTSTWNGGCGDGGKLRAAEGLGTVMHRPGLKPKDLVGMPWRIAFALQAAGWWLRSDIIWHKPNPMPESVSDRPTKSHEYVFLLAKAARYFYDAEAIAEPATEFRKCGRNSRANVDRDVNHGTRKQDAIGKRQYTVFNERYDFENPAATRNARSVWTIPTQAFSEAHFATFPEELAAKCILAGTSEYGACAACGKPWERVVEKGGADHSGETDSRYPDGSTANRLARLRQAARRNGGEYVNNAATLGFRPACACGTEERRPCVVLDPFCGSGTTGLVALRYGRDFIGIELNAEYAAMARRRIAPALAQPALLEAG